MQRDKLLELSVLSYHRLSPKQVSIKRFTATGGTLGRSEHADWYLPDPERVVSGIHAEITYNQGHYYISDRSTNGLFVNRAIDALAENVHQMQAGDILCLGDYEIQVQLIDDATVANNVLSIESDRTEHVRINPQSQPPMANKAAPNYADSKAAQGKQQHNDTAINSVDSGISLDQFIKPMVGIKQNNTADNMQSNVEQNFDLAMDDHYLAPSALIPDDWNSAWPSNHKSENTVKSPPKAAGPVSKPIATTKNNSDESTQLAAFLTGLGLTELDAATLSSAQWQQLGAAFKQSILGLLDVMRARSKVKNNFRVNQTTFQQRENNPLKFSASMDEAFHNLFNRPSSSFMPAKQAIAEAFTDIAEHEAAMLAGVAGISSGLLAQLAPQKFEHADFNPSFIDKINPAQRQARLWQHYRLTHNNLIAELKNSNNGGVNDDFISAYEQYLANK